MNAREFAERLAALPGAAFDPRACAPQRSVPATVGDLLAFTAPADDPLHRWITTLRWRLDRVKHCGGSATAIGLSDLNARPKSPVQSPPQVGDWSGAAPLVQAAADWLTRHGMAASIRPDWPLSRRPWPVLRELKRRLARCPVTFEELFGWEAFEGQGADVDTAWATVPLYDLDCDDSERPVLLSFLNNQFDCQTAGVLLSDTEGLDWPESVRMKFEGVYSATRLDELAATLAFVAHHQRFRVLPKRWRSALRAICDYDKAVLGVYDPQQSSIEISDADSLDFLLDSCAAIMRLRRGLQDLVMAALNESCIWQDLLAALDRLARRHTDWRQYETLKVKC